MWDRTGENQAYVRQQKAAEEQPRFDKTQKPSCLASKDNGGSVPQCRAEMRERDAATRYLSPRTPCWQPAKTVHKWHEDRPFWLEAMLTLPSSAIFPRLSIRAWPLSYRKG
jgi:hypothetical protein